uniref:Armadillo repeat-containing protein 8 n=1 Tax=Zea mays TaxID=4577 RepID=A0A804NJX6_MAIZE
MPATASGGARPEEEEEEVSPAPSPSTSASACMGTRAEELTARLAATGPRPGAGRGAAAAGGEEVEHERVRALREIKNQIIGNRTKKLLYLRLGAVPSVVAALAEPGASPAALVQAAAAAGSFACGVDDGARAVLAAGAVGHLTRLLAHPDEKVVDASARALRMIYQSRLAPKFDVNSGENVDFVLSLLDSENENVTELAAAIVSHSCESSAEQLSLCSAGVPQKLVSLFGCSMNLRDACLGSIIAVIQNNQDVASRFASTDHGKGDEAPLALTTLIKDSFELQRQALTTNAVEKLSSHLLANPLGTRRAVTILLALSELCSKLEESRSQLMSVEVSTLLLEALKHDWADIRVAACSCLKNISRSPKILSGGRLSCDTVIGPLVQLLNDSSTSVQVAALGAICNIAINLTPRKSVLLHSGEYYVPS